MSDAQGDSAIEVVYREIENDPDSKFLGGRTVTRVGVLNSERLAVSLAALCTQMDSVFSRLEHQGGQFELSGFELSVEFTAGGQIRVVGSLSAELKGGATLTFTRKAPE